MSVQLWSRLFNCSSLGSLSTYIVDRLSINLTHVVRASAGVFDHFHSHRRKDSVLALLLLVIVASEVALGLLATEPVGIVLAYLVRYKEASIVACEL